MASPYMCYALCFVHVEHSVCHEAISVLINIFMLLAQYLLSTLLLLTQTMREFHHWPSIAIVVMRMMVSMTSLYIYIYMHIYVCRYIYMYIYGCK